MTVTIVGSQLGDEGKGGVVDLYGDAADVVARYQGGDNAGHTVVHDGTKYKLSLVPSGAVRGKIGVLGNGCVVNPETLFDEIDTLRERGLEPDVRVAERAHVILPYHRALDGIEEAEKEDLAAGTTKRGIGPTYEDKARPPRRPRRRPARPRRAPRAPRVRRPQKKALAEEVFDKETGEEFDIDHLYETYREYGERPRRGEHDRRLRDLPARADRRRRERHARGRAGTSLDIDHGVYPYVTSSNPTAGGATVGTGLGPTVVGDGEVIGIVKAYLSRVGTGPLPTELGGVEGQTPDYTE